MEFKIPYNNKSCDEAFALAKEKITSDYVSRFKVNADIEHDEVAKKIMAKGKGFSMELAFKENEVVANLNLGLLFKAFKNPIVDTIKTKLEKYV